MKLAVPSGHDAISWRTSRSVYSSSAGHQRAQPVDAVPRGERLQGALGHRGRGDLGGEVAERHPRDAHVRADHLEDRLDRLAAVVEPQPGQADALLEDLGVVAGARARAAGRRRRRGARSSSRSRSARSSKKTGLKTKMSCRWMPPSKGSFITNTSPGRSASPHLASSVDIACGTEPRWKGTVTPCATVSPSRVADRGREVHAVADDGRVGGAEDRRRHLVGDRRERVADDLLGHRVDCDVRSLMRAPGRASRSSGSRRTVQPGRTTTVVSYSSTSSGPGSGCSPIEARAADRRVDELAVEAWRRASPPAAARDVGEARGGRRRPRGRGPRAAARGSRSASRARRGRRRAARARPRSGAISSPRAASSTASERSSTSTSQLWPP